MGMGHGMHGQGNNWIRAQRISQELRNTATDAERLLWQYLRSQQLGVKFRRQHPYNNFVLDFVCLEKKLVVELDGGQHSEATTKDETRTRELAANGFRILRFWNNQVFQEIEAVIETIMAALAETHPHPCPPLEGEGAREVLP